MTTRGKKGLALSTKSCYNKNVDNLERNFMYQFEVLYFTLRGRMERIIIISSRCALTIQEARDKIPDCKRVIQCRRI